MQGEFQNAVADAIAAVEAAVKLVPVYALKTLHLKIEVKRTNGIPCEVDIQLWCGAGSLLAASAPIDKWDTLTPIAASWLVLNSSDAIMR